MSHYPRLAIAVSLVLLLPVWTTPPALADSACSKLGRADTGRIAIVIGNASYLPPVPALTTPGNDARAVADVLAGLGFSVFRLIDATKSEIDQCVSLAMDAKSGAELAVLYYSGHAVQNGGLNYLVLGQSDIRSSSGDGLVALQPLVEKLQENADAALVFLDACVENGLSRDGKQGLSVSTGRQIRPPERSEGTAPETGSAVHGIMVAYASLPNTACEIPSGSLSTFSQSLVELMPTAGSSVQDVMNRVTNTVGERTLWAQTPWARASLTGEIKLAAKFAAEDVGEISKNWAAQSAEYLRLGQRREAIIAALKGLPDETSAADIERFPEAFDALTQAFLSGVATIPIDNDSAITLQSPDKTFIAATTKEADGYSNTIWEAATRERLFETLRGGQAGWPYFFSLSERFVAQTKSNSRIDIWSIEQRQLAASLKPDCGMSELGTIESIAFSPNDSLLLVDQGNLVVLYDIEATPPTCRTLAQGATNAVFGAAASFVDDERVCIAERAGGNATQESLKIKVVDLAGAKEDTLVRTTLPTILYGVYVECSRSGQFASLSYVNEAGESYLEIWDRDEAGTGISDGAVAKISAAYGAQFSSDSAYLAYGGLSDTKFVELRTMQETSSLYGDARLTGRKEGVFSANGNLIAGYPSDARIWLWKREPTGLAMIEAAELLLSDEEAKSVAADQISWSE